MPEPEERGWRAKIVSETKGPKEGVVRITVEYEDTTRAMATGLQDKLAGMGIELNKVGI